MGRALWFRLKAWAHDLKRNVVALWIAARDPRTPPAAKLLAAAVTAYALSPIDLIPDFIPVLGYLDDLLIVPLGILLAVRSVPLALMEEFRVAATARAARPVGPAATAVVVTLWLAGMGALTLWAWPAPPG